MRHILLILALFIIINFSSQAQLIDIIVNKDSTNIEVTNYSIYDKDNFTLITAWSIVPEPKKLKKIGGEIINTKDGGKTWDTLKSWYYNIETLESKEKWDDISYINRFGKDVFCIYFKNGYFERYDFTDNSIEGRQLFILHNPGQGSKLYSSLRDDSSAVFSPVASIGSWITYDKGKNWLYATKCQDTVIVNNMLTAMSLYLIDNNKNLYQFYGKAVSGVKGFDKDNFILKGLISDIANFKFEIINFGIPAFFGNPLFIDNQTAFVPGFRVYFEEDSVHIDSLKKKPVIYKTTDAGKSWFKIYETEYFCGSNSTAIKRFGDTLILPYVGNLGYIISTNLGETWSRLDLTYILPNGTNNVVSTSLIDSKNAIVLASNLEVGVNYGHLNCLYHLNLEKYLSAPEEPKVFLPDAKIFPNPAVDYVNIEFEPWLGLPSNVELYDILGNKIPAQIYRSEGSVMINTVALSAGTYTVRISTPNGVIAKAFVKGL